MTTYTSFSDVWTNAATGTTVTVSDGSIQPFPGTREYQNWLGRNFDGTLVAKIAGTPRVLQVTLTLYGITVNVYEPTGWAADNTAANSPLQTLSNPAPVVMCNAYGEPKIGEQPLALTVRRFNGTTDVTSSTGTTWSVTAASYAFTTGLLSITGLTATSTPTCYYVQSVYNGVTLTSALPITFINDATDTDHIGTTYASGTASALASKITDTTSYTLDMYDVNAGTTQHSAYHMGLSAVIAFNVDATATDRDGSGNIWGKWQYRVHGTSGAWTDAGTEIMSQTPCSWSTATGTGTDGMLRVAYKLPMLTTSTIYDFRIVLRLDSLNSMSSPFYVTSLSWATYS